jgi:hypothetical protein
VPRYHSRSQSHTLGDRQKACNPEMLMQPGPSMACSPSCFASSTTPASSQKQATHWGGYSCSGKSPWKQSLLESPHPNQLLWNQELLQLAYAVALLLGPCIGFFCLVLSWCYNYSLALSSVFFIGHLGKMICCLFHQLCNCSQMYSLMNV